MVDIHHHSSTESLTIHELTTITNRKSPFITSSFCFTGDLYPQSSQRRFAVGTVRWKRQAAMLQSLNEGQGSEPKRSAAEANVMLYSDERWRIVGEKRWINHNVKLRLLMATNILKIQLWTSIHWWLTMYDNNERWLIMVVNGWWWSIMVNELVSSWQWFQMLDGLVSNGLWWGLSESKCWSMMATSSTLARARRLSRVRSRLVARMLQMRRLLLIGRCKSLAETQCEDCCCRYLSHYQWIYLTLSVYRSDLSDSSVYSSF